MGMSSVKQGMQFVWNVKNFAQNLLIIPDQHGGVNQQQTQRLSFVGGGGRDGGQLTVNSDN